MDDDNTTGDSVTAQCARAHAFMLQDHPEAFERTSPIRVALVVAPIAWVAAFVTAWLLLRSYEDDRYMLLNDGWRTFPQEFVQAAMHTRHGVVYIYDDEVHHLDGSRYTCRRAYTP